MSKTASSKGSQRSDIRARIRISGPESTWTMELGSGINSLGRNPNCDVVLPHESVASKHALIEVHETAIAVLNIESESGVVVDDRLLEPGTQHELPSGARIEIGTYVLDFVLEPLPGLSQHSLQLLQMLPGIYHSDFVSRFLALFESVLLPIEWNVDNFDLYLSPGTAPAAFLPWLAHWFSLTFDATWQEHQRREILSEAHWLFATLGTKRALVRVLEIYTGEIAEIEDSSDDLEPHTFIILLPLSEDQHQVKHLHGLIEAFKPAHTAYQLQFAGQARQ